MQKGFSMKARLAEVSITPAKVVVQPFWAWPAQDTNADREIVVGGLKIRLFDTSRTMCRHTGKAIWAEIHCPASVDDKKNPRIILETHADRIPRRETPWYLFVVRKDDTIGYPDGYFMVHSGVETCFRQAGIHGNSINASERLILLGAKVRDAWPLTGTRKNDQWAVIENDLRQTGRA